MEENSEKSIYNSPFKFSRIFLIYAQGKKSCFKRLKSCSKS